MIMLIINHIYIISITYIVYKLFDLLNISKAKKILLKNKLYNVLSDDLMLVIKKDLLGKKGKFISPIIVILAILSLFLVSFVLFFNYLKILSTSVVLSFCISILPIFFIKILLNQEKTKILGMLPMYAINIKSHIEEDNNIISAIQKTTVEEPLRKYIEEFKMHISRGMNVIEALDILKQNVNIKDFDAFINSCEVCYLNGGNFSSVLDYYISIITKENIHKESTKEKAYSDILTLIIMVVLNIFVIVAFVFSNKEYALIIRETILRKSYT